MNGSAHPAIFKAVKGFLMRSDLPGWAKPVLVAVYLSVFLAGLAFIAFVGPMAGDATVRLYEFIGPIPSLIVFVIVIVGGYALGFRLLRREERREYLRTRIITVEKANPTPLWAKIALGFQAVLLVLGFIAIAAGGFR